MTYIITDTGEEYEADGIAMGAAVVEIRTEEATVEHRFKEVADAVEYYRAHPEATRIWLDEPGWRIRLDIGREGERWPR